MKAIMLSVRPKWVQKILNGEKTIEIRKSVPKDFKGWVYIYCTKDRKFWKKWFDIGMPNYDDFEKYRGKVVARFWLDEWEEIKVSSSSYDGKKWMVDVDDAERLKPYYLLGAMTENDFHKYSKGTDLFAWHIKQLEIIDKPKELDEFLSKSPAYRYVAGKKKHLTKQMERPPQSWCYVEVEETTDENL